MGNSNNGCQGCGHTHKEHSRTKTDWPNNKGHGCFHIIKERNVSCTAPGRKTVSTGRYITSGCGDNRFVTQEEKMAVDDWDNRIGMRTYTKKEYCECTKCKCVWCEWYDHP